MHETQETNESPAVASAASSASASPADSGLGDLHAKRIAGARRQVWLKSTLINGFLAYYFFWGLYYLGWLPESVTQLAGGETEGQQQLRFFVGLIPVSLALGALWTFSKLSFGRLILERTHPLLKGLEPPMRRRWITTPSGALSMVLLALTVVLGWRITEMSLPSLLSRNGIEGARNLFTQLFTPELDKGFVEQVLAAMVETVFLALMATLIAVPIAFLASFFTARNLMNFSGWARTVYVVLRVIFNFARSVEPLIWAIIFTVWVGIGPFAGMLALMIHSIAALAKLYSEQIESIDRGPIEAIEATGANRIQVVWYAVVPQIVLPYLSFTIYRWDINVRMATVIGLVGGGGVGTLLMQYTGQAKWHHVGTCVIAIAIVVWIMDTLSARIREAIY